MKILTSRCIGCGMCLDECPLDAIRVAGKKADDKAYAQCEVDYNKCANCGACTIDFSCPADALVEDDYVEK